MGRIFFVICFLSVLAVSAQNEKIKFLETDYDFGTVNEMGGPVTHRFLFVNEGENPITIRSARASCGCTTPAWEKSAIEPGDTGYLSARYNPKGRPGNFHKYVTMHLASGYSTKFTIHGFVQSPMKNPEKVYREVNGALRFARFNLNFGHVDANKKVEKIFTFYNQSSKPITVEPINLPKYISIEIDPKEVPSKMIGNIRITYDGTLTKHFGMKTETIKFKTNDETNPIKEIKLNAEIVEVFTDSAMNDPDRPVISFNKTDLYIGKIQEGEETKSEFVITNIGKSPLYIRNVYSTCSCLVSMSKRKKIKPGKSTKLKVEFDSSGKSSYVNNKITVISNDPNNPRAELKFRAKVIEKE